MKSFSILILFFLWIPSGFCKSGTVLSLKGKAYFKKAGHKNVLLKKGSRIKGNGLIKTGKRSFVRIKFTDKTTLVLGPRGVMSVSHKDPRKPRIIELLRGKLRGSVDPKAVAKYKHEHKLYIKTRSAALGVRGTEFVVIYNDKNHITSNITLKGEVDLYKKPDEEIFESIREEFDEGGKRVSYSQEDRALRLRDDLNHYKAKRIPEGRFAGAFPSYDRAINPVKVSKLQLNALRSNRNLKSGKRISDRKALKNNYKINSAVASNDNLVPQPLGKEKPSQSEYNQNKSESGTRHGGLVDLKTGIYIAPPEGSRYDKKSQSYLMPDNLGGVSPETGEYVPPDGIKLDSLNGFVPDNGVPKSRRVRENIKRLKSLTGSFNERFKETLKIFKDISRIDLKAYANYQFQKNVVENYYGEFKRISDTPTMLWDIQGFMGVQAYHTKHWLIYPKGKLGWRFHERSVAELKEHNTYKGMVGTEVHYKHNIKGKKARMIADVELSTRYTDFRKRNLFDFYTEDASLKLSEQFSLNRYNHIKSFFQMRSYQGFRNNDHGNIHNMGIEHESDIGPKLSTYLSGVFSYRRDKIDSQKFQIFGGYFKGKWKEIMRKSDLTLGYTYQVHNSRNKSLFDKARYYKVDLLFHRRKGNYLKFNLLYEFERQKAKNQPIGSENRSFISQSWGGGLTVIF